MASLFTMEGIQKMFKYKFENKANNFKNSSYKKLFLFTRDLFSWMDLLTAKKLIMTTEHIFYQKI